MAGPFIIPDSGPGQKRYPTIIETLRRYAPRPYKEYPNNPKNAYSFCCPFHDDHNASFSVNADGTLGQCWAGCGGYNSVTFYRALSGEVSGTAPVSSAPKPVKSAPTLADGKAKAAEPLDNVTLDALCQNKGLDRDFCHDVLGWRDDTYRRGGKTTQAVYLPYLEEDGTTVAANRYRTGLTSKQAPKYLWKRGSRPIPYGLPFLYRARELGYIIIEEGETDFAALAYHGIPALGIAGNQMWKEEFYPLVEGLKVYINHEGGQAGHTMVYRTAERIIRAAKAAGHTPPEIYKLSMPEGFKDPCEVAHVYQARTPEIIQQCMDDARHLNPDRDLLKLLGGHRHGRTHLVVDPSGDPAESRLVQVRDLVADAFKAIAGVRSDTKKGEMMQELVLSHSDNFLHQNGSMPPIPVDNPHIYPWQGDYGDSELHGLCLAYSDGEWEKSWNPLSGQERKRNSIVVKGERCGTWGHLSCPTHGTNVAPENQGKTKRGKASRCTCNLRDDPNCPSDMARSIAGVKLPDLPHYPDGASYRTVMIARDITLPDPQGSPTKECRYVADSTGSKGRSDGEYHWCQTHGVRTTYADGPCSKATQGAEARYEGWTEAIRGTCQDAQHLSGTNLQVRLKRKAENGKYPRTGRDRVYFRALTFHMDFPVTTTVLKVTFYECRAGALNKEVERLAEKFGGKVIWDSTTQSADEAQLAMTLAAFSSLASLDRFERQDPETRKELHKAFWQGTRNQKIHVPMDRLADLIAKFDAQKEEAPTCEICGQKLYWEPDNLPTVDSTSPSSPDYAWRDPRDGPPMWGYGMAAD